MRYFLYLRRKVILRAKYNEYTQQSYLQAPNILTRDKDHFTIASRCYNKS